MSFVRSASTRLRADARLSVHHEDAADTATRGLEQLTHAGLLGCPPEDPHAARVAENPVIPPVR